MKKILIGSALIALIAGYFFWPEKVITYPPGVLAPDQPIQKNLTEPKVWQKDEFTIKALAEYQVKARVLSRNDFSVGKESKISPIDLALGWGRMSDQSVMDRIKVTQNNRWYRWTTDSYPIPRQEIMTNSANVHIIPALNSIEKKLDNVYKGSLIEMRGYLVEVTTEDRWYWKSSLKRDDTGGGSCELLWVEEIEIFDKN